MKKLLLLALALVMVLSLAVSAVAETIINPDELSYPVGTPANKKDNPVIEGEHPFTGLKAKTDEERDALERFTPILVVYDNNAEGYMHWGVGSADIIFQVPNQSMANNKLLALYASRFPVYAGGLRSARMTAFPFALALNTAFASAGMPPEGEPREDGTVGVNFYRKKYSYTNHQKYFDCTSGRNYHHKLSEEEQKQYGVKGVSASLAHIQEMRNDWMLANGVTFEKRPFLFTDEPLTRGEEATVIDMQFRESTDPKNTKTNENSNCTFRYEEGLGYTRDILAGTEFDRETEEFLYFANVIVMRVKTNSKGVWGTSYLYYENNLVGSGKADIFQNGRYIRGAWYREKEDSRLIFLDDEGNELQFQRGASYIVVNDNHCVVTYE